MDSVYWRCVQIFSLVLSHVESSEHLIFRPAALLLVWTASTWIEYTPHLSHLVSILWLPPFCVSLPYNCSSFSSPPVCFFCLHACTHPPTRMHTGTHARRHTLSFHPYSPSFLPHCSSSIITVSGSCLLQTLRGSAWKGKDCNDAFQRFHPGAL